MMISMPNHGTRVLGLTRLMMVLQSIHQKTEDTEYIPIQIPGDNSPPSPGPSKNNGGAHWNRPLNQIKIMKIMQMKILNK